MNAEILLTIVKEYEALKEACYDLLNNITVYYFGNKEGRSLSTDRKFYSYIRFYTHKLLEEENLLENFIVDIYKRDNHKCGCDIEFSKKEDCSIPFYEANIKDNPSKKYKSFRIDDNIDYKLIAEIKKHNIISLPSIDYMDDNFYIRTTTGSLISEQCPSWGEHLDYFSGLDDYFNSGFHYSSERYNEKLEYTDDEIFSNRAIYDLLTRKINLDILPDGWAELLSKSDINLKESDVGPLENSYSSSNTITVNLCGGKQFLYFKKRGNIYGKN